MTIGKPVMTTKLPGMIKEFSKNMGVIYGDRAEGALDKAVELIGNGYIRGEGRKAGQFVEKLSGDNIVDEFLGAFE